MMLFDAFFTQLLKVWYLLPLGLLFLIATSPAGKGWFGEFLVNQLLKRHFSSHEYRLFKNVTIPTEDGTTQIDHILVSPYGIFVIETKHYRGWIFGTEKQATWTQTVYRSKFRFQNPLRQNYKHTESIRSLLDLPHDAVCSVIVFTGDAQFKTKMPNNVIKLTALTSFIKSKTTPILNQTLQQSTIQSIESGRLKPSRQTNKQHIQHVKLIQAQQDLQPVCSRCGDTMVMRTSKQGEHTGKPFWGCSSFPKCRNTQKVDA